MAKMEHSGFEPPNDWAVVNKIPIFDGLHAHPATWRYELRCPNLKLTLLDIEYGLPFPEGELACFGCAPEDGSVRHKLPGNRR